MRRDLTELAAEITPPPERRQGKASVWTFVDERDGKIIAKADWGSDFEFDPLFWAQLPLLVLPN